MAPTEVLARQTLCHHYPDAGGAPDPGKGRASDRIYDHQRETKAYDRIECGYAKIIVGTHALIQDAVNYDNLALVVTDEQHGSG